VALCGSLGKTGRNFAAGMSGGSLFFDVKTIRKWFVQYGNGRRIRR
jgi:glutamate synthase domain-containing protein 3